MVGGFGCVIAARRQKLVFLFRLSAIDANSAVRKDQAFTFGGETEDILAHTVTWYEDGGNTIVQADVDGNTATAEVMFVLTGIHNLTSSDFLP